MIKQTNYFSFPLFAPLLIGFISPDESEVSDGNLSAIDLNKNEACNHIHDDPEGVNYKIREIKLNGNKEYCCTCNPGYKLVGLCS